MPRILAQQGNLTVVDFGGPGPLLTKKQLSHHPAINRSERWIEQQMVKGMPSSLDQRGRRRFLLSEVQDWLAGQKEGAASG